MEKLDVSQAAKRIRSLMQERKYREVVKIADSLNLNRINNGLLILDIVEAYERLGDKKAARQALLNYYDVHGITGRNMMQKLIELCIETRDISNAVGLCMEFENEWPESSISYLMRYQITTSAGGSLDERIYYLEKYKEAEFEERWGYELAKLYDRNNQKEECAEVCHEIICFFGTGKYVEKAVQLKERVAGLTEDEISIVEAAKNREKEAKERREEEERLAREEMARMAEEEERRNREYEERRNREELYRRQEEERKRQEEEYRRRIIEEEQKRFQQQNIVDIESFSNGYENGVAGGAFSGGYGNGSDRYGNDLGEHGNGFDGIPESGTDEAYAAWRARQAEAEKIRQTEEAARLLKEKKEADRIARERKIAEALKVSDRYAQIEKNKSESIYFDEIITNQKVEENPKSKKDATESGGIFSSFGRMASSVKKTLQPDEDYLESTDSEIQYITIGRESQAYAEDVEERMLGELDMLDDEQIDELSSAQIKEIYELKILHDVRENIKELITDTDSIYHMERSQAEKEKSQKELERFVSSDPYANPLDRNKGNDSEEESADDKEEVKAADISEETFEAAEKEESVEAVEKKETGESKEPVENIEAEKAASAEVIEKAETGESAEAAEKTEVIESAEATEKAEAEESGEMAEKAEAEEPGETAEKAEAEEPDETAEKAEAEESGETAEKAEAEEPGETAEKAEAEEPDEMAEKAEAEESGEMAEKAEAEESGETVEEADTEESGETVGKAEAEEPGEMAEKAEAEESAEEVEETEAAESGNTTTVRMAAEVEIAGAEKKSSMNEAADSDDASAADRGTPSENMAADKKQPENQDKNSKSEQMEVKQTILDRIADPDENLTVKEFSECIMAYAETKGYQVEDSVYITIAVLADEMQQKNTPLSLNNAKIMTDDAIVRIQKRNPLDKIVDRYSKKHAHLLKDKHFYWKY